MPLDVVLVSPYPAPDRAHRDASGVASYTAHLARALAARGTRVRVVAPDEGDAPTIHVDGDVTVLRSGPRGPFALTRAVRMAADMGPDVIHLQHELFLYGGAASLAALPLASRRMRSFDGVAVTTLHQVIGGEDMSPELMRLHRFHGPVALARMAMDGYRRLVASSGTTIVHEAWFARHIPDAVVIPHGVEMRPTPNRRWARRRLGMEDEQRLVVLCFGFVAPYKGLEPALAAAADIPEAHFVVAGGDHPRHGSTHSDRLRSRWGNVARFTGWVPEEDIATWHAAADLALFWYPAPHSSSGALAVALGHGTPLLASAALAECMGLPGELAVSLDRGSLTDRLGRLAADRDLLADLKLACARVAAGRLWPDVARRHLRLYEDLSGTASVAAVVDQADGSQLEAV